jgi:enamine deaminase RidA (YjgF/YER057c/UK114 family)
MKRRHFPIVLLLLGQHLFAADPAVRYVKSGDDTAAAVVPFSAALVHTGQILSPEPDAAMLMAGIKRLVTEFHGDPDQIVKVNVATATQEIADKARAALPKGGPPVSFVVGALPHGKQIGIDVVAVAQKEAPIETSAANILPAGPRVYISGQAEKGASPADAAAKTIGSLLKTLEFLGVSKADVVQAKCFLTPMSAAPEVMKEFEKAFGRRQLPLVFVEWKSDLPIEIELIAAAPVAGGDVPPVQYLTPAGMKASPLYARVVRINRGDVIYTAGLYAEESGTGEEQVLSIFDQLQRVLKETNGDLKHLAKATYYVSDDDASKQLNVLRPKFYDPARPPAASKAMVPGVGMKDRSIEIDMIGVVAPTTRPATATP